MAAWGPGMSVSRAEFLSSAQLRREPLQRREKNAECPLVLPTRHTASNPVQGQLLSPTALQLTAKVPARMHTGHPSHTLLALQGLPCLF